MAVTSPAAADPLTATVSITSADFASPHSRTMLDRRIRSAIESICGSYATVEGSQIDEMDACWRSARAQVSTQLADLRRDSKAVLVAK
jgi:UrcA family protein